MVSVKKIQTKKNGGAGSRQVASSRRRPLSSRNATEVYCLCSLETALVLFGPGGRFYNPRIEALLRSFEQSTKRHSEQDANEQERYREYYEAVAELNAIKRIGEEIMELWDDIGELSTEEMMELNSMLDHMQLKVRNHITKYWVELSSAAESCPSNVAESFECSASIASGGSGSVGMDVDNGIHGRN